MCFKIFLAISQVLVLVSSEKSRFKKARLFSFDTNDADIEIDLDFSVPFIRIPVKKTVDAASSFGFPTININPASIALGGVIVMATTVLIPHMLKTYASGNPNQRYSKYRFRIKERRQRGSSGCLYFTKTAPLPPRDSTWIIVLAAADFETEDLLEFASKMLAESRSVRGCALRVACWTGQVPVNNDFVKIWDHVLSNKLISSMVNSTAVEDAVLSGRQGRECSTYRPCPLREHHLRILMTNAAFLANGLL